MRTFGKVLSLGLLLTSAITWSDSAYASTLPVTTLDQELSDAPKSGKFYKPLAADVASVKSMSSLLGTTQYDNAYLGTATMTAPVYFGVDAGSLINVNTSISGVLESYQSAIIPSSSSATFTHNVTQTLADGVGTTTKILKIIFTAPASPPALTRATITNFLNACAISSLAASSSTPTTLTSTSALATGWTAKAWLDNGSGTAVAMTLDPVACTMSLPVTVNGSSTATTFTTSFPVGYLTGFNVATNSTTTKDISFASGGDNLTLTVKPGPMTRTAGTATTLLGVLNTGLPSSRRIGSQSLGLFLNNLDAGINTSRSLLTSSPNTDLQGEYNKIASAAITHANWDSADFQAVGTSLVTNKHGFIALTSADVTVSSVTADGEYIVINGKIGAGGETRKFKSPLLSTFATDGVMKVGTNERLDFTSPENDLIAYKAFDATGLDVTSVFTAEVPQSQALASLFAQTFNSVLTTVVSAKLDTIVTRSQS
ncbi:MAG: hypothetical protein K2X53_01135 [Alphaproteobacteria bacterium]|nr:hypothetical protein [Alphaproteobacteria bacterium]